MDFPINIWIRNVGASPALNAWIAAEVVYAGQFAARREEFHRKGREHAGNSGHIAVFPGLEETAQRFILRVPTSLSGETRPPPMVLIGVFYKYPGDDAIHESVGTFALDNIPKDKASDGVQCLRLVPSMVPFRAT